MRSVSCGAESLVVVWLWWSKLRWRDVMSLCLCDRWVPIFLAESTTDIITGIYGGESHEIIYAVFTTPPNSIPGSAVCAFSMRAILDTFEGSFKEQQTLNSNWLPVHPSKVRSPCRSLRFLRTNWIAYLKEIALYLSIDHCLNQNDQLFFLSFFRCLSHDQEVVCPTARLCRSSTSTSPRTTRSWTKLSPASLGARSSSRPSSSKLLDFPPSNEVWYSLS